MPLNFLILFLWRSPMVSVCSSVFKLIECLCCSPLCDLYSFAYFIHSLKPFFSHCLLSSTPLPECLFFCNYLNVISPLSFWLHLYLLVCSASLFISLSHRYQRTIGRDGWHRCVTAATICKIFCLTLYFFTTYYHTSNLPVIQVSLAGVKHNQTQIYTVHNLCLYAKPIFTLFSALWLTLIYASVDKFSGCYEQPLAFWGTQPTRVGH